MGATHLGPKLIAYLTGELRGAERERVAAHLAACAGCRREHEAFQRILGDLKASAPAAPEIHWGRWRAELDARLEARRRRTGFGRWLARPVPLVLSAGVAGVLLALALLGPRGGTRVDLTAADEAVLGDRLDLLRQYPIVERLDLFENFDVIVQLDQLERRREG